MSRVVEALVDDVSSFPIQTKTIEGLLLYDSITHDVPGLHKQYNFYIYTILHLLYLIMTKVVQ
jgi:hypothetical protein